MLNDTKRGSFSSRLSNRNLDPKIDMNNSNLYLKYKGLFDTINKIWLENGIKGF